MKRLFYILFLIIFSISLSACSLEDILDDFDLSGILGSITNGSGNTNGNDTLLKTPVVTISSDGLAKWDSVDNAKEYQIVIRDGQTGEERTFETQNLSVQLNSGESIKVKAISNSKKYLDSKFSDVLTYNSNLTLGEQIKKEYEDLTSGKTTNKTVWTATGTIMATYITFNATYQNYTARLIVSVDDVLICIHTGLVDGNYLNEEYATSLENAKEVTFTGEINIGYSNSIGGYNTDIQFYKCEITWDGMNDSNDDNTGDDNPGEDIEPGETKNINFIMINDTHGALLDSSDSYSVGRVDTLINSLTDKNGDYIKVQNGDAFQGSFISGELFGLPLVEAFNVMELDCFVLGNHEFDWGIETIATYKDGNLENGEANFPFLGANIYKKGTTTRPNWIDPYTVVEYDGIQVGIIGAMGPTHESSILTSYISSYEFVDPVNIISEHAKTLRNSFGCEVVVVAIHDYDEAINKRIAALSGNSEIDAIFCAHTHQYINETVTRADGLDIPVVQNTHKNNKAAEVVLSIDTNLGLKSFESKTHAPGEYEISERVGNIISKYNDLIEESNVSLGYTSSTIYKSTLGSYATEAMAKHIYNYSSFDSKIDMTIINTAGVRATIKSGDITKAKIFEVFPFNNKIILVNISGKALKSLYEKNKSYLYVNIASSIGSYTNFNDSTIYQVAVIDYVFEGTYYSEFKTLSSSDYIYTNVVLRDLLITYLDEKY